MHAAGKLFTKLDLKKAFCQMTCNEGSRHKLAFNWKGKSFVFTIAAFGLKFLSAQFKRLIFKDLYFVMAFVDDIWIVSENNFDTHLRHTTMAMQRLTQVRLRINAAKCHFFLRALEGLGHMITPDDIQVDPEKVAYIKAIPLPAFYKASSTTCGNTYDITPKWQDPYRTS